MASARPISGPPLPRELRLSPRCIITKSGHDSLPRGGPSPFSMSHSRQSSVLSTQSSSASSSLLFHRGRNSFSSESRQPLTLQHGRQTSSSSSSASSNSFANTGARPKAGYAVPPRQSATPPPHKMPPFTALSKMSPTSVDMGYHTMVTYNESSAGENGYEDSPFTSMELQLNTEKMTAEYKCNGSGQKAKSLASLDDLPDEVIVRILSNLSTNDLCVCARVSRRLYFLTWDSRLWTRISLSGGDSLDADSALETLLRLVSREDEVCSTVTKVCLSGCSRLTDSGLFAIARRCPQVRRLELRGCRRVTNRGLAEVVSRCSTLTYIDAMGEFCSNRPINNRRPFFLCYVLRTKLSSFFERTSRRRQRPKKCPNHYSGSPNEGERVCKQRGS